METTQPPPLPDAANSLDPEAVGYGQAAFERSCTACHDAERAFGKSKSYAGWLATVRRMAAKDGAEISSADVVPIATYLASVAGDGAAARRSDGGEDGGGGWSFGTTVSTLHRSASDEYPRGVSRLLRRCVGDGVVPIHRSVAGHRHRLHELPHGPTAARSSWSKARRRSTCGICFTAAAATTAAKCC